MKKIVFLFSTIIFLMTNLYANTAYKQERLAIDMYSQGYDLGEAGKAIEAIKVFDKIAAKFKNSKNKKIQEQVAFAKIGRASCRERV